MTNDKKIFAFKLADKKDRTATTKWKARDGVSLAGCTDPTGDGDFRYPGSWGGFDNGVWC